MQRLGVTGARNRVCWRHVRAGKPRAPSSGGRVARAGGGRAKPAHGRFTVAGRPHGRRAILLGERAMDRRSFVFAGAGTAAAVTLHGPAIAALGGSAGPDGTARQPGALARRLAKKGGAGRTVTLTGWATPAAEGPGHYIVVGEDGPLGDPACADPHAWPQRAVRVYPTNGPAARVVGPVRVTGRLYVGKFEDTPTGRAASRVMVGAVTAG
jgi:hypothetical protein